MYTHTVFTEQRPQPLFTNWEAYLSTHSNRHYLCYLVEGIRNGFHTGCRTDKSPLQVAKRNMLSVESHPAVKDPVPFAEDVLSAFVAMLAKDDLSHSSIKL